MSEELLQSNKILENCEIGISQRAGITDILNEGLKDKHMTDRPITRHVSPSSCAEFKPSEKPSLSTRQHFPDFGMQPIYNANATQTKLDQKQKQKKQLNLTASQAAELMRRFNELELAHFDLQQKYGR